MMATSFFNQKSNCDGISKSDAIFNLKQFNFIYPLSRNQQKQFSELLGLMKPYMSQSSDSISTCSKIVGNVVDKKKSAFTPQDLFGVKEYIF